MRTSLKKKLLWPKYSKAIDILNRDAQMRATLKEYDTKPVLKFSKRKDLYASVNESLQNDAINYLEFGVWKGVSMEMWVRLNTNPNSRFYGFDSFEGLPEDWTNLRSSIPKEEFAVGGRLPDIRDSRVTFIKGWFQHTLRDFLRKAELVHPLVVNVDSDLHSSALYVLSTLDPILKAGDVIIFDEYPSPHNEFLAWEEYKRSFMRNANCFAMSNSWDQVAFSLA